MTAVVQFVAKGQLVQSKYKPLSRLIYTSLLGKFAETQRSYSLIPVEIPWNPSSQLPATTEKYNDDMQGPVG